MGSKALQELFSDTLIWLKRKPTGFQWAFLGLHWDNVALLLIPYLIAEKVWAAVI